MARRTWCVVSWVTCGIKARGIPSLAEAKCRALSLLPTMPTGTLLGVEVDRGPAAPSYYLVDGDWLDTAKPGATETIRAELMRIGAPVSYADAASQERVREVPGALVDRYNAKEALQAVRADGAAGVAARALHLAAARVDEIEPPPIAEPAAA